VNPARWIAVASLLVAASARAECPTTPDDAVCRPWSALLLPTAFGGLYSPHGLSTTYVGGGVEAVLLAWSDNTSAFGPSQGRVRLDVGLFDSTSASQSALVMFRTGAQVSFERNASRAYGIPFFVADVGALWTSGIGRRWFVDGGVGVYVLHRRSFIVDVEVTAILPFSDPKTFGGIQSRIGLSFALW
jgi:hypothetical protein